ncbi:MAG: tetratricopeptide repeat protein [Proteobacteria bacterium]|nr:tetratricopeptide repeat protein [Pseudomonadota bacterium]
MVDIERQLYESKRPGPWRKVVYAAVILISALAAWHTVAPRSLKDTIGLILAPREPALEALVIKKGRTRRLLQKGDRLERIGLDEPLSVERLTTNVPFNQGVTIAFYRGGRRVGPRIRAHALPFSTTIRRLLGRAAVGPEKVLQILIVRRDKRLAAVSLRFVVSAADRLRHALDTPDPRTRLARLLQAWHQGDRGPRLLEHLARTAERAGEKKLAADFYVRLLRSGAIKNKRQRVAVLARLARVRPNPRNLANLAQAYLDAGWPGRAERILRRTPGWDKSPLVLNRLLAILKRAPGRRGEYLQLLEKLSQVQPRNVRVLKTYVRQLERQTGRAGNPDQRRRLEGRLLATLVKLGQLQPRSLPIQRWVMGRLLGRGWYRTALPVQKGIVKLTHNDPDEKRALALVYRKLGNVRAAETIEESLADQLPPRRRVIRYLMLAEKARRKNQPREVTRLLEKALAVGPNNLEVRWRLAGHLMHLKRWVDAGDHLAFLARKAPDDRRYRLALVQAYERDGQLDAAARVLNKWVARRPDDRPALLWLLQIRAKMKDRPGQIEVYRRLAALPARTAAERRRREVCQNNLVALYLETRNWAAAAVLLHKLIKQQPQNAALRELLRQTLIKGRRLDEAAAQTLALVKMKPERLELIRWLADYFEQKKQYPQMASVLRRGLKASPRDLELNKSLARAYLLMDKKDLAAAALQKAVVHHPRDRDLRLNLALLLDKTGRFKDALTHYRILIRRDAKNRGLLLRLARLYRNMGRYQDVVSTYQRLHRLFPRDKKIKQALDRARRDYLDSRIKTPNTARGR